MSGAIVVAFALSFVPPAAAQADGGDAAAGNAFVEVVAEPATLFVGQPLRVAVRFGFTADFLRDHVVSLFAQPLDVEAQLDLPWIATLAGARTRENEPAAGGDATLRCALNDGVATVRRAVSERRDGRDFTIFELVRGYLPERAGMVAIPTPSLRFAWASRFDDDLLRGHVALDRSVALVRGKPLELAVAALPTDGQPADFSGAVGSLSMRAELAPRGAETDGAIRLLVTIEGDGNLEAFATPLFPELDLFHRVGTLEEKSTPRRRITLDLMPRGATATQVPALAFTCFDPKPPARYRTLHTQPIAFASATRGSGDATSMASSPATPTSGATDSSREPIVAFVAALALVALLALVVARFVRRRGRDDADPVIARARTAAANFTERARQPGADLADALAEYLAARLATTPAAVISPELAVRLSERAIPPELAALTAATLQALVAARYGARRSAPTQEVPMLVRELEAAFTAAGADRSAGDARR